MILNEVFKKLGYYKNMDYNEKLHINYDRANTYMELVWIQSKELADVRSIRQLMYRLKYLRFINNIINKFVRHKKQKTLVTQTKKTCKWER